MAPQEGVEVRFPQQASLRSSLLAAKATVCVITGSARARHLTVFYDPAILLVKPRTA
jgi:hypothetical protein